VHILLPPSEGKTAGGRGRPLALSAKDEPLSAARETVLTALERLVAGSATTASGALLLPPGVAAEAIATNAAARGSATMPALRRYAGVVYDGLDLPSLTSAAAKLAGRRVLIFSGLLGVVRGDEPVPNYRVPAKAQLPGVGVAGTFWRPVLTDVLRDRLEDDLVIDLRSSDYASMWRPDKQQAQRVVTLRFLSRTPSGKYAVVSYNSKFAKGRLVASLLTAEATGSPIRSVEDVAANWHGPRATQTATNHLDLYTD
jgi:cytoplasmic iron level regulating protein YaaA (DUF328/UPF0246 family)